MRARLARPPMRTLERLAKATGSRLQISFAPSPAQRTGLVGEKWRHAFEYVTLSTGSPNPGFLSAIASLDFLKSGAIFNARQDHAASVVLSFRLGRVTEFHT